MGASQKRRIEKLEDKTGSDEKIQIVVHWDDEPSPPGTIIVTWDDEDEEGLDDD